MQHHQSHSPAFFLMSTLRAHVLIVLSHLRTRRCKLLPAAWDPIVGLCVQVIKLGVGALKEARASRRVSPMEVESCAPLWFCEFLRPALPAAVVEQNASPFTLNTGLCAGWS